MAFIVEDGTVVANANSFCTVQFADDYFADRGVAAWAGTNEFKEQRLVQATDYISMRFRFRGAPVEAEQALPFPRTARGPLPAVLLKATCEYALRAITAPLAPDPTVDTSGGKVLEKKEKVGPIEESYKYSESGSASLLQAYPAADMLLRGLLAQYRGVIR